MACNNIFTTSKTNLEPWYFKTICGCLAQTLCTVYVTGNRKVWVGTASLLHTGILSSMRSLIQKWVQL